MNEKLHVLIADFSLKVCNAAANYSEKNDMKFSKAADAVEMNSQLATRIAIIDLAVCQTVLVAAILAAGLPPHQYHIRALPFF